MALWINNAKYNKANNPLSFYTKNIKNIITIIKKY